MKLLKIYLIDDQPIVADSLENAIITYRKKVGFISDIRKTELLFDGIAAYYDDSLKSDK